jgi:uncharacterized protein YqgC (DUF456 family)
MVITVLLTVAGVLLVLTGLVGLVLPLMPGSPLVLLGLILMAWAEQFAYVGTTTFGVLFVLMLLTFVVDNVASALGAGRVGASKWGLLGAMLGTLAGVLFFPVGLLLGPFVGAVAGELLARSELRQAGRVGVGAVIGVLLGTAGNVGLGLAMVGVYLVARLAV